MTAGVHVGTVATLAGCACLAVLASAAQTPVARKADPVVVRDAWIREAPATQAATAAYAVLENVSAEPATLTGVSVEGAGLVELHEMVMKGDMMAMAQVPSIRIPARGTVALAPGGLHIMVFDLTKDFVAGATVAVTFRFADGISVVARAQVRKKSAMGT